MSYREEKLESGFGLLGIIIIVGVIGVLAGGGFYFKELQQQKSLFDMGIDAEKQAQELKSKIEEQQNQLNRELGNPPPQPQAKMIDTSTWKTYRNEKYGFEVRYPTETVPNKLPLSDLYLLSIGFVDALSKYIFHITIRENTLNEEITYQKFLIIGHIADDIKNETRIIKGIYNWVKLEYEVTESLEPVVIKKSSVAIINNGRYSFSLYADSHIIDQILSTFKFLP